MRPMAKSEASCLDIPRMVRRLLGSDMTLVDGDCRSALEELWWVTASCFEFRCTFVVILRR